jgi:DNA-binding transcriptional LysR family regulator
LETLFSQTRITGKVYRSTRRKTMRFQKLDLNLLVALDALLRERSISRAAEHMHLSQSAMSSALARLRAYFEDDLLISVGRKLELTSRAEVLKEAVRDVLMRVDTSIATAPEFDPSESDRKFQLAVSDYTAATLIPHVLALAEKQSRTVRFDLIPVPGRPQRALESGDADLMVISRPYALPDHPTETLYEEGALLRGVQRQQLCAIRRTDARAIRSGRPCRGAAPGHGQADAGELVQASLCHRRSTSRSRPSAS